LPFFGQNCSLPFSLWSLDIPAILKSWKKHYWRHLVRKELSNFKVFLMPVSHTIDEIKGKQYLWIQGSFSLIRNVSLMHVLSLQVRHIYICDFHKTMIQSVRTKRKRKESDGDRISPDQVYGLPSVHVCIQNSHRSLKSLMNFTKELISWTSKLQKGQVASHSGLCNIAQ
jgi:hypothetical protein